ncbi:ribokinase [Arsenicitalea aurantiaca]|uniref:Ribokinase n=1 Tax=Arsenicitalea aurantiaca TaxID=1783274 RepID=A0A433X8F2_9HYPH|nr:ribokinase [Arsenicitalea aurantiaca]RUT30339.1 ribokinase [Arsenicitalea aurantiaca]
MITVLGSVNLDQIGTVTRLPAPGETVAGGTFSVAQGGKGANQALAARRAGAAVRMVGAVGEDAFAEVALRLLTSDGVDLSDVARVPGATGIAMIFVDEKGENVIAILPGANAAVDEAAAMRALGAMARGDILLLQQEIPQPATARALALARQSGVVSILNTAPFLPDTAALAEEADIVIANETEFALLMGKAGGQGDAGDLDSQMEAWANRTGRTIIVTLGGEGARSFGPDGRLVAAALPITPLDTVGAGDTFCGYLAAGLDAGLTLKDAMARATIAASLACLKPGAQPAIPYAGELAASIGSR